MAKKLSNAEIKKTIKNKGGKLLKVWREYDKWNKQKLYVKIECKKCKHVWKSHFYDIKRNHWCKQCRRPGMKPQAKLLNILQDCYPDCNFEFNYRGFDWLKTKKGGKQEIDIFIFNDDCSFTLGVEYDGRQHFMPVNFGWKMSDLDGKKQLKNQRSLDKLKNNKIAKHPEDIKFFIRFSYKDNLELAPVIGKLIENGVPV